MRKKHLFVLCVLNIVMFCATVCPILAKAPDTPKIVFTGWRGDNRDIYLMNPDGSEQVNITNHRADDVSPIWSPTGEHILFASDRDGPRDLYLMDPDGSNVRRVFGKSATRRGPAWGPDEKQIVYNHGPPGNSFHIHRHNRWEKRRACGNWRAVPPGPPTARQSSFAAVLWTTPRRFSLLNVKTNRLKFFPFPKEPMFVRGPAWSPSGDKLAFSWHIDDFRKRQSTL